MHSNLSSVCLCVCVCLSGSHTFLVVRHSYVLQETHAFLGMLPFWYVTLMHVLNIKFYAKLTSDFSFDHITGSGYQMTGLQLQ